MWHVLTCWDISMYSFCRSVEGIPLKVWQNSAGRPSLPGDLSFSKGFITFSVSATVISWSYSHLFLGQIFFLALEIRVSCILTFSWFGVSWEHCVLLPLNPQRLGSSVLSHSATRETTHIPTLLYISFFSVSRYFLQLSIK